MPHDAPQLKPAHQVIKAYYAELADYLTHNVSHEQAVRTAFQNLLAKTAKKTGWHLVPEQPTRVRGKQVRPDGTLRDHFNLHRGYWEAKDSADKLDVEIRKKTKLGYPLTNTIFEDTRTAVLFQNGAEIEPRFDLTRPQDLCDLLNKFYSHTEPDIEGFERAVDDFKERVPELALGLKAKIEEAHKKNPRFQEAFDKFFELCRQSLNPNLSVSAVDEMLIQHLLTIRLFDTIFDNPDFVRRNVIAAEVEKVIDALTSKAFSREQFLKSLDRFYVAIELAARVLGEDFTEKQHFLNTVYERFFQGYSVKVADTHGIVYTPQEIVDFMCASVAEVLEKEFGKSLGSKDVNILDPCTGTGNFIVNLIRRIPKRDLQHVYREQLFANEVMLLPYYIAALNIEHAYFEQSGEYEPFEGLCFVDTLDLAEARQASFSFMTARNTERVERQKHTPITVIIGNPPYNIGQLDENDNNKNRKYPVVETRIRETYSADSAATNKNALSDAYVKFFRWAIDRLGNRDGIVCFVSNNSFVEQLAFDGMRKHLLQDFSKVYHLHLEGNVRQDFSLAGSIYNVFGIKVGVGITLALRLKSRSEHELYFSRLDKYLRREQKLQWLSQGEDIAGIEWLKIEPDRSYTWLAPENVDEFNSFLPLAIKGAHAPNNAETLFASVSPGVKSNRDDVVYDFRAGTLLPRVQRFIDAYNGEVDRYKRTRKPGDIHQFVNYDILKWSETVKANVVRGRYAQYDESKLRKCLYRPFTKQWIYFHGMLVERRYQFPEIFPKESQENENIVIWIKVGAVWPMFPFAAKQIVDLLPVSGSQCVSFYMYSRDGTNRRENITDWALEEFREHYGNKRITKWDIFYYVYGILHHPAYREKFADNFKRELPRIPFAPDFKAFAAAGKKLAELHLGYEQLEPRPLKWIEAEGVPLSYHVAKMRLAKDKSAVRVNDSLTLAGIPPETFDYRLGNRSALDWVIDQYQVKTDKRSGITSDPNNPEDEQYIVRLVGQVVRVSIETVKIVNALPREYC
ncbi:MAG: type ISP restriction/modification enzyme [Pirellulales bacterium]